MTEAGEERRRWTPGARGRRRRRSNSGRSRRRRPRRTAQRCVRRRGRRPRARRARPSSPRRPPAAPAAASSLLPQVTVKRHPKRAMKQPSRCRFRHFPVVLPLSEGGRAVTPREGRGAREPRGRAAGSRRTAERRSPGSSIPDYVAAVCHLCPRSCDLQGTPRGRLARAERMPTHHDGVVTPLPSVVAFDVNETLSDMSPMARRFTDVGAPEHLAKLWFASLLRDGFALAAAGASAPFIEVGRGVLRTLLTGVRLDRPLDDAIEHVFAGFSELGVHPDVVDGVRALRRHGLRLVTMTNGSASVAERLLTGAGVRAEFEVLLSVEDAGVWKPAARAYQYAAERCGVLLEEVLLVAVHPWDVDGAVRAGMQSAWIDRSGTPYPAYLRAPTYTATSLTELAGRLTGA